jgi:hypothetical protein
MSAGTKAEQCTKVEPQVTSDRHIANANVGSSSSSSDATLFAAQILLKQVPEESFICAHWVTLAILKLLQSNPSLSMSEFKNILKELWPFNYATAEERFIEQNS